MAAGLTGLAAIDRAEVVDDRYADRGELFARPCRRSALIVIALPPAVALPEGGQRRVAGGARGGVEGHLDMVGHRDLDQLDRHPVRLTDCDRPFKWQKLRRSHARVAAIDMDG